MQALLKLIRPELMEADDDGLAVYKSEDNLKGSDVASLLTFVLREYPKRKLYRPFDLLLFLRVLKASGANSTHFPPKIFPYLRSLLQKNQ